MVIFVQQSTSARLRDDVVLYCTDVKGLCQSSAGLLEFSCRAALSPDTRQRWLAAAAAAAAVAWRHDDVINALFNELVNSDVPQAPQHAGYFS